MGVPKGSFYHYFDSKEAFGSALITQYADYFARKIDRHLLNENLTPMARLHAFVADAQAGMARHAFQRGCLIGNLGQEMGALPESFRSQLRAVFTDWESRFAVCLCGASQRRGVQASRLRTSRQLLLDWLGGRRAQGQAGAKRVAAGNLRTWIFCRANAPLIF